ncbi:uncharacterized protein [Fopius arisanus]|uniref:LysS protein n=1 Tax=Fopius arisanus TaxID=64838 RepID=A0A0C9R8L6_9HYME|nr:PREDICTED: uncharacterized protein LOC105272076 [Fopius arisanus]
MSQSEDVKIQIQKILISINDITEKIKQEMGMINEMVKAKGHLTLTIDEANDMLAKIAKKRVSNPTGQLLDTQYIHDEFDSLNAFDPITMDLITQKLMAIMDT